MKPLCVDLFCGKFGWGCAFADEGYRVVGFDLAHEDYHGPVPRGCELVLQDVLTLHGSQFRDSAVIVASPPCQAYSYRAMPWKRAKALPPPDNTLFEACFRIQREASESAGRHIPMVVENVRGAQRWVGRAAWHYGSFYLWGDVPALMPSTFSTLKRNPDGTEHRQGSWFAIADSKNRGTGRKVGVNFHEYEKTGKPGRSFQSVAVAENGTKVPSESGRRTDPGKGARFTTRDCGVENGTKCGGDWFGRGEDCSALRRFNSKSSARKAASAEIARIPYPLAQHIARVFKP